VFVLQFGTSETEIVVGFEFLKRKPVSILHSKVAETYPLDTRNGGTFSGRDGMSMVQPKDEAVRKVVKKRWYNQLHYHSPWLIPSCTTAALQTVTIDAMQVTVSTTGGGATEVKCAGSGAPASKFVSGAFFMVSVFVSLVVASV
jgi:hypothetical protein